MMGQVAYSSVSFPCSVGPPLSVDPAHLRFMKCDLLRHSRPCLSRSRCFSDLLLHSRPCASRIYGFTDLLLHSWPCASCIRGFSDLLLHLRPCASCIHGFLGFGVSIVAAETFPLVRQTSPLSHSSYFLAISNNLIISTISNVTKGSCRNTDVEVFSNRALHWLISVMYIFVHPASEWRPVQDCAQ